MKSTARSALPFPEDADTPDGPTQIKALAEAIEKSVALPAGTVLATARATAPEGFLLCEGQAVSRTTFAGLFAAIGTGYGAGNGSTTFNLPDLRGRVPVGVDGAAARLTANDTRGAASGAEKHTLATGEMPSHNHTASQASHSHRSSTGAYFIVGPPGSGDGTSATVDMFGGISCAVQDTDSRAPSVTVNANGGGAAHNNMPPYQVVNYMVKI